MLQLGSSRNCTLLAVCSALYRFSHSCFTCSREVHIAPTCQLLIRYHGLHSNRVRCWRAADWPVRCAGIPGRRENHGDQRHCGTLPAWCWEVSAPERWPAVESSLSGRSGCGWVVEPGLQQGLRLPASLGDLAGEILPRGHLRRHGHSRREGLHLGRFRAVLPLCLKLRGSKEFQQLRHFGTWNLWPSSSGSTELDRCANLHGQLKRITGMCIQQP